MILGWERSSDAPIYWVNLFRDDYNWVSEKNEKRGGANYLTNQHTAPSVGKAFASLVRLLDS